MSGYPIDDDDDDEMDNYYKSDYDFTSTSTSIFRFKNYSADKEKNNFEDVDSGKPMTITMPSENIDKLQYESAFKDVSFNTKINQIIKNHLDWYSNAPLARMSYISKSIVAKAIDQLTEEQLSEFAQSAVNDLQEMSLLLREEFSFSSFLDILNI